MRAVGAILALSLMAAVAEAQRPPFVPSEDLVVTATPGELVWTELADGRKLATLYGNPNTAGHYVLRVVFPARVAVPFHWHPTMEFGTVLEGTVYVDVGLDASRDKAVAAGPGSFVAFPPYMPLRLWTGDQPVTVQVHGEGPFLTVPIDEATHEVSRRER